MTKAEDMFSRAEEALSKIDKDRLPKMELPQYYIVFTRPVKLVDTEDGGMNVLKFDWGTGGFVYGMNLLSEILFGHGEVDQVTEDEFIQYVEKLRARRIKPGEGTGYFEAVPVVLDVEEIATFGAGEEAQLGSIFGPAVGVDAALEFTVAHVGLR